MPTAATQLDDLALKLSYIHAVTLSLNSGGNRGMEQADRDAIDGLLFELATEAKKMVAAIDV